jgi:mannosyltransferase OCH1-like enzyme
MRSSSRLLTVVNKNGNKPVKPAVEVYVKSEEEILKELLNKLVKVKPDLEEKSQEKLLNTDDKKMTIEENMKEKEDDTEEKDVNMKEEKEVNIKEDDTEKKDVKKKGKEDVMKKGKNDNMKEGDKNDNMKEGGKNDNTKEEDDKMKEEEDNSTLTKEQLKKADLIFDNIDKSCEFEIQKFIKDCWEKSVMLKRNIDVNFIKSKIPFNVYQSYASKNLPEKMELNNSLLKISNPEFDFILVDAEEKRNFIKANFKENVLEAYDNLVPDEFKNNLWVYCNLYLNGGIYLDINYGNVNNFKLSQLVNKNYFVVDKNNSLLAIDTQLIITEPKNSILLKVIDKLVDNVTTLNYGTNKDSITGSTLLASHLHKIDKNIKKIVDSYELSNVENSIFRKGEEILTLYKEYLNENLILNKVNKLWLDKMIFMNAETYDASKLVTLNDTRENSMTFDFVEKIIYMDTVDEELLKDIPMKKLISLESNKNNLVLSSVKNMLKALKLAIDNNWSNVMILDDKFSWDNFDENYQVLKQMTQENYDVIVLGGNGVKSNKVNKKMTHMISLHGFLVNKLYLQKLYENVKEVFDKLSMPNNKVNITTYSNMKKLFKDNWLALPSLMTKI